MLREIRTEDENEAALAELDRLLEINADPEPDSEIGIKVNALIQRIKRFEEVAYPFELPEPVDLIEFRMDQMGLAPEDMLAYFDSVAALQDVLARRRELTLDEIRALHDGLGISAEILIRKPAPPEAIAA